MRKNVVAIYLISILSLNVSRAEEKPVDQEAKLIQDLQTNTRDQLQYVRTLRKELAEKNVNDVKKEIEELRAREKIFKDNKFNMGLAKTASLGATIGSGAMSANFLRNLMLKIGPRSENKKRFLASGAVAGISTISMLFFSTMEESDSTVLSDMRVQREELDQKLEKYELELSKLQTARANIDALSDDTNH